MSKPRRRTDSSQPQAARPFAKPEAAPRNRPSHFRSFLASRSRRRRKATRRIPQFQRLESRRVFDASAVLDEGVVQIDADAEGGEITVVESGDSVSVMQGSEQLAAFDVDAVMSITFLGGDGDDNFANNTSLPSEIHGGAGDDTLQGGSADDTIHGDEGDDRVLGGEGDDVLFGGTGDDILRGGDGDDALYGESGVDELFGEDGADYLDGGDDQDTLTGGAGADQMLEDPPGTSSLLADLLADVATEDEVIDSSIVGNPEDPNGPIIP